jgi:hypothetical protein
MTAELLGRPRSQAEAHQEFEERRADFIQRCLAPSIADILADIYVGKTEDMHRWRVRLDCGHIREVLTHGKNTPPQEGKWIGYLQGEYPCNEKGCRRDVMRDIVSWDQRHEEDVPPDPEDPPDWWGDTDPALWTQTRRDDPWAQWDVTLTCGHQDTAVTDADWKPEDGITRRPPPANAEEQRRRDWLLARAEADGDEYDRRYITDDFPEPVLFTRCYTCSWARKITAQQAVGPLVAPPHQPQQTPDPKAVLERRLRDAEQQAASLRKQLAVLSTDEPPGNRDRQEEE